MNPSLSKSTRIAWQIVRWAVFLIGIAIFLALLFFPKIGIHAFWNVLIPVAPALLVIAVGIWRNICPLGFTALFPRKLGISKKKKLSVKQQGLFLLIGVLALYILVPVRHVIMDTNGLSLALVLLGLVIIAIIVGSIYDWKSAWCSGLCPINPVERLYGTKPGFNGVNAHCSGCVNCLEECTDSIKNQNWSIYGHTKYHRFARFILVGGFAGFVFAWFFVPDYYGMEGFQNLGSIYGINFLGFAISIALYAIIKYSFPKINERKLINVFAGLAVIFYYWFRLPMLFGFSPNPGDGMLVDLRDTLSPAVIWTMRAVTTLFFAYWMILRKEVNKEWIVRPDFVENMESVKAA